MPAEKPTKPSNPRPTPAVDASPPPGDQPVPAGFDLDLINKFLKQVAASGGFPVQLSGQPTDLVDTAKLLNARKAVAVPFPPCADLLLSLILTTGVTPADKDDITLYFDEYFKFGRPVILFSANVRGKVDDALLQCVGEAGWPPDCCVCDPCLTLDGNRNSNPTTTASLKRLFLGDVLFLHHWEWMFQVLGVILSDYATHGRLPISNGSLPGGPRDEIVALVLETMVQQTNAGASSRVRDRDATYRRTVGLTTDHGRKLNVDAQANTRLCTQFHALVHHASQFFDARRMAVAIRGSAAPAPPASVATLTMIGDIVRTMRQLLEVFDYGRNFYNTLNGLVWLIAGMSVVREIRTTLGIPPAFDRPHEYLEAAYSILVKKSGVTAGEKNLYTLSRDLARNGRDLLLDLEVLNGEAADFAKAGGELEDWLTQVEAKVESYRTAYRALHGVDLGAGIPSSVPHQA
jgi:hypothetical protein